MSSSIGHAEVEEVGGALEVGLEVELAETLLSDTSEDVAEETEALEEIVESDVGYAVIEVADEEVNTDSATVAESDVVVSGTEVEEVGSVKLETISDFPEVVDCGEDVV